MKHLKRRVLLPLLAFTIVAVALIVAAIVAVSQSIFNISTNQVAAVKVERLASFLDGKLGMYVSTLRVLAASERLRAGSIPNSVIYLRERAPLLPDFAFFFAGDTTGYYMTTMGRSGNISDRDYFPRVMRGETIISDPVISKSTGKPIFVVAAPVRDMQNRVIGIVAGTVLLERLTKAINSEQFGQTGYAYLMQHDGTVIAHPRRDFLLTKNLMKDPSASLASLARTMADGHTGIGTYSFEGVHKTCAYTRLASTNWTIVVTAPTLELFTGIRPLIYLSLVVIIVIGLLVLYVTRLVAQIVQRQQAELELREQKQKLAALIGNVPGMVYRCHLDPKWTMEYVSDGSRALTGFSPDDLVGNRVQAYGDLILPEEREESALAVRRALAEGQHYELVHRIRAVTGDIRWIWHRGCGIPCEDGTITCLEGLATNITELREKDRQLQQAQKMEAVGTLAGGLAHDFNNILGGVLGPLSLLQFKLEEGSGLLDGEAREYVQLMEHSAKRATDLVQQLLALSRHDESTRAPVDLNLTVKHVLKICSATFDRIIQIQSEIPQQPSMVEADPTQMEQILLNLCINAYHAMTLMRGGPEKPGSLTVSLVPVLPESQLMSSHPKAQNIPYWCLNVRDTGVGIESKDLARLFDPFYTTKAKGVGTGLGLAVVNSIVNQHGGFVDVWSELGVGTQFSVYLPVLRGDRIPVAAGPAAVSLPRGEGTVLVVDDDESIRHITSAMLRELGYRPEVAGSGQQAMELLRTKLTSVRAVILDMVMPFQSGEATFCELRKISPTVPIVLTTGYRKNERVQALLDQGFAGFLQKPFTIGTLARILKTAIGPAPPPDSSPGRS